jgi:hypothetical protein
MRPGRCTRVQGEQLGFVEAFRMLPVFMVSALRRVRATCQVSETDVAEQIGFGIELQELATREHPERAIRWIHRHCTRFLIKTVGLAHFIGGDIDVLEGFMVRHPNSGISRSTSRRGNLGRCRKK